MPSPAHLLSHIDPVGQAVIVLLLALAVSSWYLILTKVTLNHLAALRAERFLKRFWAARALSEIRGLVSEDSSDNAFAELAQDALDTLQQHRDASSLDPIVGDGLEPVLARTLRNGIQQEDSRLRRGLMFVESSASAALYIGLFGTAWGVCQVLVKFGLSDQGTSDPLSVLIGEALMTTALGFAIAILAAVAQSGFKRRNRMWLAKLEAFAHELFVMIALAEETGNHVSDGREASNASHALPGSFVNAEV